MQFRKPDFNISFAKNDMLIKLIYINLAVFLAFALINIPYMLMGHKGVPTSFVHNWLAAPAALETLIRRPWTLLTYMFLHTNVWHIIGNLLWLYVFGQMFMQFLGERKLLTVYIAGGLAGVFLYIFFYNVFPVFEPYLNSSALLGASAGVMAIVAAVGTYSPNAIIRLLFLGEVKLKYIAIGAFLLDIIRMPDGNPGGHIAHIGGAALGFFFARYWLKGTDITSWISKIIDFITSFTSISNPLKNRKMKVRYKSESTKNYDYNARKKEEQEEVDIILDKISKSGYDSLSKKEKEILFKASGK